MQFFPVSGSCCCCGIPVLLLLGRSVAAPVPLGNSGFHRGDQHGIDLFDQGRVAFRPGGGNYDQVQAGQLRLASFVAGFYEADEAADETAAIAAEVEETIEDKADIESDAPAAAEEVEIGPDPELVRAHFPLKPQGIIEHLKLRRPIYRATAAFGHFGRSEASFSWEATDKADAIREDARLTATAKG